jgi:hypothetical protein
MHKTKDTMKAFVDKAQPVIQEIKRVHNEFIRLQYFAFSPEDLYEEDGTIDFIKDNKYNPEDFDGPINAIYAQFGEETGAALEIAASERDAISLETHLSTLHDLREEAKDQGQISAAITAEVHRGKAGGLYIDRREILTAKIDLMSKDDILDRLENLIKKRTLDAKVVEGEVSAD